MSHAITLYLNSVAVFTNAISVTPKSTSKPRRDAAKANRDMSTADSVRRRQPAHIDRASVTSPEQARTGPASTKPETNVTRIQGNTVQEYMKVGDGRGSHPLTRWATVADIVHKGEPGIRIVPSMVDQMSLVSGLNTTAAGPVSYTHLRAHE